MLGESTTAVTQSESRELEQLIERYQAGEPDAATAFVEQVSPRIFQFLLTHVRDKPLAEDVLQEFWLRIHKARHTYRLGEPVWPWLFAIARRVQIDNYRRRSRISHHEVQTESLPDHAHAGTGAAGSGESIVEMLQTLPQNQREAVVLLKVTGLSLEEAARATGISVGAVKQRAHRAFQTLRGRLGINL